MGTQRKVAAIGAPDANNKVAERLEKRHRSLCCALFARGTRYGRPKSNVGWRFDKSETPFDGCVRDPEFDADFLKDIYFKADPEYSGRFTVPVLWDKLTKTIVNNESADIIKMLNCEFDHICENPSLNLRPTHLVDQIEESNQWIYEQLNNGVYKAGFATSQEHCTQKVFFR